MLLTFLDGADETPLVSLDDFAAGNRLERGVPARLAETADGTVLVTTVYDLLMAQYGVPRGLPGAYPEDYDDENAPYTPAWAERYTGVGRKDVLQFAREWATRLPIFRTLPSTT